MRYMFMFTNVYKTFTKYEIYIKTLNIYKI